MTRGNMDIFKHVPQEIQLSDQQAEPRVVKIKCLVRLAKCKKGKHAMLYLIYFLTILLKWDTRVVSDIS